MEAAHERWNWETESARLVALYDSVWTRRGRGRYASPLLRASARAGAPQEGRHLVLDRALEDELWAHAPELTQLVGTAGPIEQDRSMASSIRGCSGLSLGAGSVYPDPAPGRPKADFASPLDERLRRLQLDTAVSRSLP